MRLSEVAGKVGLTFSGHDIEIHGVNTLVSAGEGQIAPLLSRKYLGQLAATRAGAVLCEAQHAPEDRPVLVSANPKLDWARVVALSIWARPALTAVLSPF